MRAAIITRTLHSRGFGMTVGVLAFLAGCIYFFCGLSQPLTGDNGLALPSANEWIPGRIPDFVAGMAGSIAGAALMLLLNKIHNILRSMTSVYLAFFGVMMAATPSLLTQFYTGTLLMIAVGLSLLLILGCYRDPRAPSKVFVIFLMLSTLTATQYCYIFYAPVFLIACAQMRIFNGRTLTAALLGLVTPWWIMLGFGIISPDSIHLPHLTSIFSEADNEDAVMLLATAAVTALLFLTSLSLNLMKAIAYNAMARAINGVITVTALATIAAMAADYRNIIVYIPILDFCAALQTAHYFSAHRADRSFIAIILILVIYVALFACQIIM